MVTVAEKSETLGKFVERVIFDSRVSKVIGFIDLAKKALGPAMWKSFCSYGATQSTIGNLVDCIARQVANRQTVFDVDDTDLRDILRDMLDLFDEIQSKAQKIGEPIDVASIIKVYNL